MNDPPVIPPECSGLPPLRPPSGPPSRPARAPAAGTKAKGRRRSGDRFATLNGFLDFTAAGLTRAEVLTWLLLWRDTKADGTARTGISDLARRAGVNRSTVIRSVAKLAERGLLIVIYRGSLRRGPSAYRVRPLARDPNIPPKR